MAEYLIQDTTLNNIADQVRSITGLTGSMTPAEMATNLSDYNTEINELLTTQETKIAELEAALEEKVSDKISTCTLKIYCDCSEVGDFDISYNPGNEISYAGYPGMLTRYIDNNLIFEYDQDQSPQTVIADECGWEPEAQMVYYGEFRNVVCGSILSFYVNYGSVNGWSTNITSQNDGIHYKIIANDGETAYFSMSTESQDVGI